MQRAFRSTQWPRFPLATSAGLLLIALTMLDAWAADTGPQQPVAVPAYRQADSVAILGVKGIIDGVTLKSLERRMAEAVKNGASAIVLDIDTPGGRMDSALDISNLLKSRGETPPNTVAWIHDSAYSAGTIIALSCREIVVAPGSTFGDAAVIAISPVGGLIALPAPERAKIEGPLVSEIIDSARRNHYDETLAVAFTRLSGGVWMVENAQTGERAFVGLDEYRTLFDEEPPLQSRPALSMSGAPGRQAVRPAFDQSIPPISASAGLDEEELRRQELFNQTLPPVRAPFSESDRGQWRVVREVVDAQSLLTVKADEAMYYGLASAVVANEADLKSFFGAKTVLRYDETWSEGLVRFLVSMPVRGVLIVIFLLALFIELAAPGIGVFGATAMVALLILIGAPALAGMAQWWDVLLIVVGLLLVAIELFMLPGIGIAGIGGVLCVLIGLVGTFVTGDVTSAAGQAELWGGLVTTLASLFVAGVAVWLVSRQIHSFPLLNRLILHAELRDRSSPTFGAGQGGAGLGLLEAMGAPQRALEVGDLGAAHTDLRPAGKAEINGRLVDVKSVGDYIVKGTPVRVVSVGRFVIEVEEAGS